MKVVVLQTTVPESTQRASFCSSHRFNPDTCAAPWAGWLKHFQKYTWCPPSVNQPTSALPTAANITPSFLPMASCSANHWADHTEHKVACGKCPLLPSRFFREGKGEAGSTATGPAAGLPAVHQGLNSSSGPCPMCPSGHRRRTVSELPPRRLCSISV